MNIKDIAATLAILGSGALVMSGCGKDAPATEVPGGDAAAPTDAADATADDLTGDAEGDAEGEGSCSGEEGEGSCSAEEGEGEASCSAEGGE